MCVCLEHKINFVLPGQFIKESVAEVACGVGHIGTERQHLRGTGGGVFQGWNPARYKLHSPSDVVVSDVVVEHILFVNSLLTVKTYNMMGTRKRVLYAQGYHNKCYLEFIMLNQFNCKYFIFGVKNFPSMRCISILYKLRKLL